MKFLFDLFPVILFFATFKLAEKQPEAAASWLARLTGGDFVAPAQAPILIATGVVILATLVQVLWVRLRHGKVDRMLWFSLALVVLLGGLTLAFRDERFIKWKPTLLYWGFAVAMTAGALIFKKNAIKSMLSKQFELPEPVWSRLNYSWVAFFAVMGGLNLVVAFHFATDIWVNFKLFGGMGLMLLFAIAQAFFLSKYVEDAPEKQQLPEDTK
ncbi:MAG: Intracellular septation protein [Betaproteobacteria bacterium ADurb.Bin341]|nr:MAG: Intracellular septation protein [Betaproteobacteria bacterium ADurb.Bin341]